MKSNLLTGQNERTVTASFSLTTHRAFPNRSVALHCSVFALFSLICLYAKDAEASQSGTHKSKLFRPYIKAETALLDALLLSSGQLLCAFCFLFTLTFAANYLIRNRSGLSDAALAFASGQMNFTMIMGSEEDVFSTDDMPQPTPELLTSIRTSH